MDIEREVTAIKERNARVEADKAWERSWMRTLLLTGITYIVATAAFLVLENGAPFRNALIPALGFFISVQSLPFAKRLWVARYLKHHA